MIPSIEQHVEWIGDCIAWLRERDLLRIEASPDAESAWVAHVNEVADATLFPRCNSWYLGANVPGKPRVFMPYLGVPPYLEKCREVVAKGYEGFTLSVQGKSVEEGKRLFDALSAGGKVTMPFAETFWAKGFGMLVDKFGVPWMVNCEH